MTILKNKTTISAIIPAYNAEEFISRSIESVLAQSRSIDEIIVVDDGSTDGTADAVKAFGDKVRYIYQQNAGVSAARNSGIKAASSQWIAFLDADDEWYSEYLQRQVEIIEKHPDIVWASSNYESCLCDEGKRSASHSIEKCRRLLKQRGYFESYLDAFREDIRGCTNTMIIKKQVLIETGLFAEDIAIGEDIDLWLRIAYLHPKIGFTADPMAVYHLSVPTSASKSEKSVKIFVDFVERHSEISKKLGMFETFRPCGEFIVTKWLRGMLFYDTGEDIKILLSTSRELLPSFKRALFYTLATFPKTTAFGCRLISKVVRRFNLRKKTVQRPR